MSFMKQLINDWKEAGIKEGDTLLIHSSIKRTLKRFADQGLIISPDDILESFIYAVGEKGTVILPLFNFSYSEGVTFDINNTPSHMGVLTEAARKHPLSVRTGHPIYSFAVIGAKSNQFEGVDNFSGYGADSPFALLREMHGKIAVLDLPDQNSMTFYHHVEEMLEVDYRYHKIFSGNYVDSLGNETVKEYGLFVRDIEKGVLTHVNPAGELMWQEGLYTGSRPKEGSGLRVVSAQNVYDFTADIIRSNKAKDILYRIEGEQ
ncbi:AAC(3) family N-acetyltransferase [Psychrobacter sp. H8-1]|uniref:AAC(3) family N-acetyltransferase n=1 Tax=Psychrobacter sp. H8-1 TaxID=2774129 RepID=UPI0019183CB2|nr:AAC(3) family N-acetyltransferase [Psychrobacter sp. H8-1]